MLAILAITGPIFALIGLGFACVRLGLFQRGDMRILGSFVINLALPALIVSALSHRTLAEILRGDYLLACAGGALVSFLLALLWFFYVRDRTFQESAVTAMGASISNSAFMGLPIVVQVVGPLASVALALNMVVENIIMLPLALILADLAGQRQSSVWIRLRGIGWSLLRNPVIVAISIGLTLSLLQTPLPQPVAKPIDMLGLAAAPVALFAIGGNLAGSRLGGGALADVGQLVASKLVLHPLLVALLALSLPGMDPLLQAAAIVYASMPMFSIFPLFGMKYGMEVFCSAAVVAATLGSFASITVVVWLVHRILLPSVAP